MKMYLSLLLATILSSCITTHINPAENTPVAGLKASCSLNKDMKISDYYGILCAFENQSPETAKFSIVEMKHFNPRVRLVESSEAADVTLAFQDAKEQHIYNRKMGTLAVMGLGIIAIVTGDSSTANLGAAVTTGAIAFDGVADISEGYNEFKYGKSQMYSFGDKILNRPIVIPSGLHVKKGFLFKAPDIFNTIELCFNSLDQCQTFELL